MHEYFVPENICRKKWQKMREYFVPKILIEQEVKFQKKVGKMREYLYQKIFYELTMVKNV